MAMDAVQGAVAELRVLVEGFRTGERPFDVVAALDTAEQSAIGLSHLRPGATQIQTNLEELENKVKVELTPRHRFQDVRRMDGHAERGETLSVIAAELNAVEMMMTGMNGAGMSIGGGSGGDRTRGVLE